MPTLMPPQDMVATNATLLQSSSKAGRLAVKLARESFFGIEEMKKHTVKTLPKIKLRALKDLLFKSYGKDSLVHFEPIWNKCIISIGKRCQVLRSATNNA